MEAIDGLEAHRCLARLELAGVAPLRAFIDQLVCSQGVIALPALIDENEALVEYVDVLPLDERAVCTIGEQVTFGAGASQVVVPPAR